MEFNKKQLEAINAKEPNTIIIAPVGSGKSTTLVGAVQKYVRENPTHKVAAITFTRKSASDLTARIRNSNVISSTIHSWCLKELGRLGVKYKFKVKLLEDTEIHSILKMLCQQAGYYTINQFQLYLFVVGNYNLDISDRVKRQFMVVEGKYKKHKRENNLYDFMDLPLYLHDMLEKYNEKITAYDALFVDEFQDVDDIQESIFNLVIANKKLYIGDPRQSIYMWRGAKPEVMETAIKRGFKEYSLIENYRSYQEILDFATAFYKAPEPHLFVTAKPKRAEIISTRGCGGEVMLVENYIYDYVAEKEMPLSTSRINKFLQKSPQILCRSNKEVKEITKAGYANVSTIHQSKGLEYNDVVVVDFETQIDEERNIGYVACTRARNSLMIINYNVLLDVIYDYDVTVKQNEKLF